MKGKKTGGRVAGVPNKVTGDLKAMILGALSEVGGQEYLARQAELNPSAFMTLLGKVMPTQVETGPNGLTLTYVVRAPTPVESASDWLKLHAPSDSKSDRVFDVIDE